MGTREVNPERWNEEWSEERKHRRRHEVERDRWCCPDWEQDELGNFFKFVYIHFYKILKYILEKFSNRYGSNRLMKKYDDRYYSRDSQESPWEDEYSNDPEDKHLPHYVTTRRNWKRPSSASEMERKSSEIKLRQGQFYMGTGKIFNKFSYLR